MKVLCVDDERPALEALTESVKKALPSSDIFACRSAAEALALLAKTPIDIAFLDIELREMNGLELAKRLKELSRGAGIIFVTGYADYALEAFGVKASGYLMKPISAQAVCNAIDNLRCVAAPRPSAALRVQCFGNFEVFAGGVPLVFRYAKTKELLAYLVDRRGAAISPGELIAMLWEDREITTSLKTQLRNLISDLAHTLLRYGARDVLIKANSCFAVNTESIDCDYYAFIKRDPQAVNEYGGEYMSQYSWAELTLGALEQQKNTFSE